MKIHSLSKHHVKFYQFSLTSHNQPCSGLLASSDTAVLSRVLQLQLFNLQSVQAAIFLYNKVPTFFHHGVVFLPSDGDVQTRNFTRHQHRLPLHHCLVLQFLLKKYRRCRWLNRKRRNYVTKYTFASNTRQMHV